MKPCPFCGSDQVGLSYATNIAGQISSQFVECEECAAMGPAHPTDEEAGTAWGNRKTGTEVTADIASTDWDPVDLDYLGTNLRFARGSLPRETRRDAVSAILTLRDMIRAARAV